MYARITAPPQGNTTNRWLDLDVTNEQHHAMKCISSSSVKYLASGKSPYAFYKNCILKERGPFEINEAFRIGTIAHLAILEPEKFEKSVVVCDLNQNTNDFKNFKIELAKGVFTSKETIEDDKLQADIDETRKQLDYYMKLCEPTDPKIDALSSELSILLDNQKIIEENKKKGKKKKTTSKIKDEDYIIKYTKDGGILTDSGQEIFLVKSDEMTMYRAYQSQVEKHKRLSFMFSECVMEQSGVAQDPNTGLWLSVRGDARCSRGYFADPKTMADEITADNIKKYASTYHLLIQDAHYSYTANLIEPGVYKKFFFIMMSKKAPYEIALVQFDKEDRAWGAARHREILQTISQHELSGKWPALDSIEPECGLTIKLPHWALK